MKQINKILFITLSNIGDVILTLPVLDTLRGSFPQSKITVMVGPRPKEIFEDSPHIDRLIIYDKYVRFREKVKLFNRLRKEKFDIVVDLRNTFYGALLPSRFRTSPFLFLPRRLQHMKERNLFRLQKALRHAGSCDLKGERTFCFTKQDRDYIDLLLAKSGIEAGDKIVLVSPGAGGSTRRWETEKFIQLCDQLSRIYRVILIGSKLHQPLTQKIHQSCTGKIIDFSGLTSLHQLACLFTKAALLISGDTGTLQLASYMDTPIIAVFGPSDEKRYGPWSSKYRVVKKEISCRPCREVDCRLGTVECMKLIEAQDILNEISFILADD